MDKINRRENYIIIAFIPLLFLFPLVLNYMNYDDYWFHIRIGKDILSGIDVFHQEIYSWYGEEQGLLWYNHEWLSEIFMTVLWKLLGAYLGAKIYVIITFSFLYLLIFLFCRKYLLANAYGCIMTNLMIFAIFLSMTPRPHEIGLIFFVVLLAALEEIRMNQEICWIYVFPIVAVLWNNAHGGSAILSVILPLFYLLAGFVKEEWLQYPWISNELANSTVRQRWKYIYIILCGIVGMFIHPNGILSALSCFHTNTVQTTWISEWLPSQFNSDILVYVVILIMITYVLGRDRKLELIDILMVSAFVVLTLKSRRFQYWMVLTVPFYLNRYLPVNMDVSAVRTYMGKAATKVLLFLAICFSSVALIMSGRNHDGEISGEMYEQLLQVRPQRLYNGYNLGDYLIYLGIPVFSDGRAHMYQDDILERVFLFESNLGSYETMHCLEEPMEGFVHVNGRSYYSGYEYFDREYFMEKYQFDYFLLEASSRLNAYLAGRDDMEIVYSDNNTLLWRYKDED